MRFKIYSIFLLAICYAADPRLYLDPYSAAVQRIDKRTTSIAHPAIVPKDTANEGIPEAESPVEDSTQPDNNVQSSLKKRATPEDLYSVQKDAPLELVQISIPPNAPSLSNYIYYIYEKSAGEGIYIYVIDRGVAHPDFMHPHNTEGRDAIQRELPRNRRRPAIQTDLSKKKGEHPEVDDALNSHGTEVAIKALGIKFGAAKEAILIPVKIGEYNRAETSHGVFAAWHDIQTKGARRARRSIVVMSIGSVFPENLNDEFTREMSGLISHLQYLGVPFVTTSGNFAQEFWHGQQRINIDTVPAIIAARGNPISVIGNVDFQGNFWSTSQRGPLLTASAGGLSATTLDKYGMKADATGTSVADV
ncbi:hypothetical protein NUU61_000834 [Penicillium alfredii]|uniref:Peptidase S8/S53 domain-containing protein n=1 Tax=Penicillium alfredii TaxID=1506179 RepID=A0A9W9GAB0_9EURO|nr:uncharacterized protein NUU61_000834 [Penicillium alfredii]KAJ5115075.1 hypothetical protein NUU61_000834 [Penicillium alfredii]